MVTVEYDLVVVAGGTGQRLGGTIKADLQIGGERLLERTLTAASGASTRVVVGGDQVAVPDGVLRTLEDPPAGGPAAGTAAGLAAIDAPAPWTLLLAGDLADPAAGVAALLRAAAEADSPGAPGVDEGVDGLCLAGEADHPQWLFGIHRTAALREAVQALGTARDRSMKAMLSPLRLRTVAVDPDTIADIDTPADAQRWGAAPTGGREPRLTDDEATQARWRAWVEQAAAVVGTRPSDVDIESIHRLTKQIAHGYDRPLAPVGAYIVGQAVGAARARGEVPDVVELSRAVAGTIRSAPPKAADEAQR
ncbi:hypothetical protein GCM10022199_15510 [Marihabitans asiaticum]|uniref:Molybdopterin-guanine dinucleotide biosynthesis protein A n=1 Tax=Marihabitans asiaticum TaxID=415218 RepID=A0A560W850_9MICO|nr:NTP transferase domain-containing protein [Marihabitans asiaticum]TWD13760.1 molybdopterin-guanine dinucleotide biosynthesis protein A [Marihabitans asiaticum]